jgi:hypothetical protein
MVLDTQTVTADILSWSETFVEVPHPALGGWPPCPFARQARLNRTIQVLTGADPYFDLRIEHVGAWVNMKLLCMHMILRTGLMLVFTQQLNQPTGIFVGT